MVYQHNLSLRLFVTALLLTLSWCGIASAETRPGDAGENVRVVVSFRTPIGGEERAAALGVGGVIRHHLASVNALALTLPARAVEVLKRHPRVQLVEPDVRVWALEEPNYAAELSHTWGVERIGAGTAHTQGYTGAGVKVAVVDTGIDYTHPQLAPLYKGGYDFVNNDSDPKDDHGHGTHVAGTIAALRDGAGVVGAAPSIELYALKVLAADGSGYMSDIIAAMEWATAHGMAVTNSSLGTSADPGSAFRAAYDAAAAAGVTNVAAAGNSYTRCTSYFVDNVNYPARYESVLAVGAVDLNDARACFSSTGGTVEFAAPGVSIVSTVTGGGEGAMSGTSMASPHVAGAAALLRGAGASAAQTRELLRSTARDLGTKGRDVQYGYGLVQVPAALSAFLGAPEEPVVQSMNVHSISYSLDRLRRDLTVTVSVKANGVGLSGVSVRGTLENGTRGLSWTLSGTTDSSGQYRATLRRAPSGTYTTSLSALARDGYVWDGTTPSNTFTK